MASRVPALPAEPAGTLLRRWRERRRMSQLELALEAEVSTRHLSCVETGRALPSREMLLRLAERLEVPLRERNALLLAAGYAPMYGERPLDDPAMAPARAAIAQLLAAHAPYPALAIDRHWTLVDANAPARALLSLVDPALLEPPVNALRISLHPRGLAAHILNLAEWRAHVFERLRQQVAVTADPVLSTLLTELRGLPGPEASLPDAAGPAASLVVPLRLATPAGELSLIGTTTVFGTPVDVTLSELAIESFFPADPQTAERLRAFAAA